MKRTRARTRNCFHQSQRDNSSLPYSCTISQRLNSQRHKEMRDHTHASRSWLRTVSIADPQECSICGTICQISLCFHSIEKIWARALLSEICRRQGLYSVNAESARLDDCFSVVDGQNTSANFDTIHACFTWTWELARCRPLQEAYRGNIRDRSLV